MDSVLVVLLLGAEDIGQGLAGACGRPVNELQHPQDLRVQPQLTDRRVVVVEVVHPLARAPLVALEPLGHRVVEGGAEAGQVRGLEDLGHRQEAVLRKMAELGDLGL